MTSRLGMIGSNNAGLPRLLGVMTVGLLVSCSAAPRVATQGVADYREVQWRRADPEGDDSMLAKRLIAALRIRKVEDIEQVAFDSVGRASFWFAQARVGHGSGWFQYSYYVLRAVRSDSFRVVWSGLAGDSASGGTYLPIAPYKVRGCLLLGTDSTIAYWLSVPDTAAATAIAGDTLVRPFGTYKWSERESTFRFATSPKRQWMHKCQSTFH